MNENFQIYCDSCNFSFLESYAEVQRVPSNLSKQLNENFQIYCDSCNFSFLESYAEVQRVPSNLSKQLWSFNS